MNPNNQKILSGPEIITRGFVYVRESEDMLESAKKEVNKTIDRIGRQKIQDRNKIKSRIRDSAATYFYNQTGRKPMILPIIIDITGNNKAK